MLTAELSNYVRGGRHEFVNTLLFDLEYREMYFLNKQPFRFTSFYLYLYVDTGLKRRRKIYFWKSSPHVQTQKDSSVKQTRGRLPEENFKS